MDDDGAYDSGTNADAVDRNGTGASINGSLPKHTESVTSPNLNTPIITMGEEVHGAFMDLREFMFNTVYLPIDDTQEGYAARRIVRFLHGYFSRTQSQNPARIRTAQPLAGRSGRGLCVRHDRQLRHTARREAVPRHRQDILRKIAIMNDISPADRVRLRTAQLHVKRIREHLEAMQRDAHGVEYAAWKSEVDNIWKAVFENIDEMSETPQQSALELIREPWMMYLSHYAAIGAE